ncbi:MAG: hypothetical protein P8O09_04745, partial [Flavobacteriaceae bacterium]|nr:hypothetical protein [Flavobacteriaceae bacterium]
EHQKKLKLIDSLSQELSLSNKKSQNLQSDLNNSSNDLILTSDSLKNSNLEIDQLEVKLLASKNELSLLGLEIDNLVKESSNKTNLISDKNLQIDSLTNRALQEINELTIIIQELNSEIANFKNEVSKLESNASELTKENDSLITQLKKIEDNIQVISSKETWIISNDAPFLKSGYWMDCSEERSVETSYIDFWDGYFSFGVEGGYGGTILRTLYNQTSKEFKIQYINDNDMAGNGLKYEFILLYNNGSIVFQEEMLYPDYDYNSIKYETYQKCD